MKASTTFNFFFTLVLAMSFFTFTVNCAAIEIRGDEKPKTTLPGNLKRSDETESVNIIERDDKKHKPLLPQKREGNCGHGRLCKRTNDESDLVTVIERDDKKHKPLLPQKREGILHDSLSCGHGRLCKRMNDESDSIKVIERDSIIPKPDCASHLCKKRSLNKGETILEEKKRGLPIKKNDCKGHTCKNQDSQFENGKRDKIIPKPDCSGHLCKKRSVNEGEETLNEETKRNYAYVNADCTGRDCQK